MQVLDKKDKNRIKSQISRKFTYLIFIIRYLTL